jgi:hypothetical protein
VGNRGGQDASPGTPLTGRPQECVETGLLEDLGGGEMSDIWPESPRKSRAYFLDTVTPPQLSSGGIHTVSRLTGAARESSFGRHWEVGDGGPGQAERSQRVGGRVVAVTVGRPAGSPYIAEAASQWKRRCRADGVIGRTHRVQYVVHLHH